ncbi:MAG: hypothetical protein COB02_03995 [Candidatus Cloacimonadota bacterium]|nr:MAG: hypothetical protein COB02_03995 [Candidatus Cloacimonadota bacterium]
MTLDYSILILNYNGDFILERSILHTLNIMKSSSLNGELIIVDNCSTDSSLEIIKKFSKQITPFFLQENIVLCAYNKAFNITKGKYLILLNNDEFIQENYIENLLTCFHKNPKLFLAVPMSINEDDLKYQAGLIDAEIKFGHLLLKHNFTPNQINQSKIMPFGSLGAYCSDKLQLVGGFEELLLPFYWEDVDLSYRAKKMGYEIIYEPKAITKHLNQATISKFDRSFVIATNRRNKLLFFWLNITDLKLWIYHFVFFPLFIIKSIIKDKTFDYLKVFWFGLRNYSKILKIRKNRLKKFTKNDYELIKY